MPPRRNDIETTPPAPPASETKPVTPRRNDIETTSRCPACGDTFTPIRRQLYRKPACRQAAWRARHDNQTPPPVIAAPPRTPRRDHTVYQCPQCDARRLGQQWCHDCTRPAVRVDLGGLCPHCSEPVAISDLTDQHSTRGSSL
jgi:Zn finger protein HypA/HybF involved in hydrogenase expression